MEFQVDRSIFSQVEAVSNKTKLFVICKRRFSVFDFWNDGTARLLTEDDSEEEEEDVDEEDDFSSSDSSSDEWLKNILLYKLISFINFDMSSYY